MTSRKLLNEWPLVAVTLCLQVSCGVAIAVMLAEILRVPGDLPTLAVLGRTTFPIVAAGLLLSMAHLGRPLSAWRALSNCPRSKLSREAVLLVAFSISALVSSADWMIDGSNPHRFADAITCLLGIAATVASAAVYRVRSNPIWESPSMSISSLAGTMTAGGLAISSLPSSAALGIWIASAGLVLLLISSAWIQARTFDRRQDDRLPRVWLFVQYAFLLAALLIFIFLLYRFTLPCFLGAILLTGFAMVSNRMMMFSVAELKSIF